MKVYDAASIRNVALVGHGGCGKTQLVSAMLFAAGAVNRLGRVDDGSTVTDFDEEAIARKHTLASSLAHAEWQTAKINIIDTPGFANFLTDARSALRVVEAAVVVVDAVAGVEVQTEKLWSEAAALNLPRIVVANRLERDRASLERTLESLRSRCARELCRSSSRSERNGSSPASWTWSAEGVHLCWRRQRQDDRGGGARGACRSSDAGARAAHRNGGGSGRKSDGDVLLRWDADAGAAPLGPVRRHRCRPPVPASLRIGPARHRHPAAA